MIMETNNNAGSGRQPRLVGRFREIRRAYRPEIGDKFRQRFLGNNGITEVLVTHVDSDSVEFKRHFYHDSGGDWELDRPSARHLGHYRRMLIRSLLRGAEFVPANA